MTTPSPSAAPSLLLPISAASLAAATGVWLLAQGDTTALLIAGVAALASTGFQLLSIRRLASVTSIAPVAVSLSTAATAAVATAPAVSPVLNPAAIADDGALRLLGKLQEQGRLVDFVMEDIRTVTDAQVAAVARVVHAGCRTALQSSFTLEPLHASAEGTTVTLAPGFDPAAHRLLGRVAGDAPFTGQLLHRGWRSTRVNLPHPTYYSKPSDGIVAPAEIELR